MGSLWRRLVYILAPSDPTRTEFLMAVVMLGWAYVLLVARTDLLMINPSYKPMQMIAPQVVWGLVFGLTSIMKLVGVMYGFTRVRLIGVLLGTFLWSFVFMSFMLTGTGTTGLVVYGCFALMSFFVTMSHVRSLRNRKDRKESREQDSEVGTERESE